MIEQCLQQGAFKELFIEHLGWDHAGGTETVSVHGETLQIDRIAHKRGFQVFMHVGARERVQTRRYAKAVQQATSRVAHEHILIVSDDRHDAQVWAWSYREPGTGRQRHRLHPLFTARSPPAMLKRIAGLKFTLDEEERLTLVDVTARVADALEADADQAIFFRRSSYAQRSHALALQMREGGDAAFHAFVEYHMPLAKWLARRYKRMGDHHEDFEQVAMVGLIRAAKKFDPERNVAFSTYAFTAIRRECQRYLPRILPLGRIRDNLYGPYRRILRAADRAHASDGPQGASQAYERACRDENIDMVIAGRLWRAFHVESLDAAGAMVRESAVELHEYSDALLGAGHIRCPLNDILRVELCGMVQTALGRLPLTDQYIIANRYGLAGKEETLQEIGDTLGLTRERIRQREKKALEWLREHVWPLYGEPPPTPDETVENQGEMEHEVEPETRPGQLNLFEDI